MEDDWIRSTERRHLATALCTRGCAAWQIPGKSMHGSIHHAAKQRSTLHSRYDYNAVRYADRMSHTAQTQSTLVAARVAHAVTREHAGRCGTITAKRRNRTWERITPTCPLRPRPVLASTSSRARSILLRNIPQQPAGSQHTPITVDASHHQPSLLLQRRSGTSTAN